MCTCGYVHLIAWSPEFSNRAVSFKHLKSKHSRGMSRWGPWSDSARPRGPVSPRRHLPDGPLSPGEQGRGWRVSGAIMEPEHPRGSLCSKGSGCPRDGHPVWSRLPNSVPACLKWSPAGLHVNLHSEACPWKHRDPRAEACGC